MPKKSARTKKPSQKSQKKQQAAETQAAIETALRLTTSLIVAVVIGNITWFLGYMVPVLAKNLSLSPVTLAGQNVNEVLISPTGLSMSLVLWTVIIWIVLFKAFAKLTVQTTLLLSLASAAALSLMIARSW